MSANKRYIAMVISRYATRNYFDFDVVVIFTEIILADAKFSCDFSRPMYSRINWTMKAKETC